MEIMITQNQIKNLIFNIRETQVMLDSHLAELCGVETRVLNQAVKRNPDRFPEKFRLQLSQGEWEALRSQIVILERKTIDLQANTDTRGKHKKYLLPAWPRSALKS
jgi:hypothetical protein